MDFTCSCHTKPLRSNIHPHARPSFCNHASGTRREQPSARNAALPLVLPSTARSDYRSSVAAPPLRRFLFGCSAVDGICARVVVPRRGLWERSVWQEYRTHARRGTTGRWCWGCLGLLASGSTKPPWKVLSLQATLGKMIFGMKART